MVRVQQSNMQPDFRSHICEHIIRVLQHSKDVNQKQHICVKHDLVCLVSRTGIHPTTKLHSKNLDFHPVCLTRNCKNKKDDPGLQALVPAPGLDDKDMHPTYVKGSKMSILSRNKPC
ncbi:hypothetical protein TNCV_1797091 [Trichonephila clavipes]|nr:hypothetical protein TNCV_1797091 [Trichonephila clavipes]